MLPTSTLQPSAEQDCFTLGKAPHREVGGTGVRAVPAERVVVVVFVVVVVSVALNVDASGAHSHIKSEVPGHD